jgi:hypothetical protein
MKPFSLFLFLLVIATAAVTVNAQTGLAGKTYGGDRPAMDGGADEAPSKLTGVVGKIDHFRNGLRITIKVKNNKEYRYSVFYSGQGPQTSLSVDKNVNVTLKTLDDLKVNDVVSVKLDSGNIKSLVLKERLTDKDADKAKDRQ